MASQVTLLAEEIQTYVRFATNDGVPCMEIWTTDDDGVTKVVTKQRLTSSAVNLLRTWTEEAYPRGQER